MQHEKLPLTKQVKDKIRIKKVTDKRKYNKRRTNQRKHNKRRTNHCRVLWIIPRELVHTSGCRDEKSK